MKGLSTSRNIILIFSRQLSRRCPTFAKCCGLLLSSLQLLTLILVPMRLKRPRRLLRTTCAALRRMYDNADHKCDTDIASAWKAAHHGDMTAAQRMAKSARRTLVCSIRLANSFYYSQSRPIRIHMCCTFRVSVVGLHESTLTVFKR